MLGPHIWGAAQFPTRPRWEPWRHGLGQARHERTAASRAGRGYAVPEAESSRLVSLTGGDGCFPWQRGQPGPQGPQGRVAQPRPVPKALRHSGGCWAVLATCQGQGRGQHASRAQSGRGAGGPTF